MYTLHAPTTANCLTHTLRTPTHALHTPYACLMHTLRTPYACLCVPYAHLTHTLRTPYMHVMCTLHAPYDWLRVPTTANHSLMCTLRVPYPT